MATSPGDFDVDSAYSTIMEFVGQYMVTREVRCGGGQTLIALDPGLQSIKQRFRKIKRRLRTCKDEALRDTLEKQHQRLLKTWVSERDALAAEEKRAVRERFWEVKKSNNLHLAWKMARSGLSGKGGGVKTSTTTSVSKEQWEAHFARLFNNYRGITLKSHFLKLLEAVVCARFVAWLDKNSLLPDEQLAYRKGHSGTNHLFTLHVLREDAIRRGQVLYVGFLDLAKAFPSVNRVELLSDLVSEGVSQ